MELEGRKEGERKGKVREGRKERKEGGKSWEGGRRGYPENFILRRF